jgi:lipoprotein-releasing system permease protein
MNEDSFQLPALVCSGILFALCLLSLVVRKLKGKPLPGVLGALAGVGIVCASTAGTFLFATRVWESLGERLQLPLFVALLVGGVIAGAVIAAITKRVGFFESLWVVALFSLWPSLFNESLSVLFTYGTSAAYYGVLLISWYLLLILALSLGGAIGYLLFGDGHLTFSFAYETWMGRRFLMAKRSSGAVSVITLISTIAVTVGCAGMIIVMSVMNGFSNDLRSKIMGANAHLTLSKYGGRDTFKEYPEVLTQTKTIPGVIGASPFALSEVMISYDRSVTGAVIKGIDVPSIGTISNLPENMIAGELGFLDHPRAIPVFPKAKERSDGSKPASEADRISDAFDAATEDEAQTKHVDLPGIVIGKEMSRSLRATVGDVLNVVSPVAELGPSGPVPKAKAFRVAGVFYTGMFDYDSKLVYISLTSAQDFFGMKDAATGIEYKLVNADDTQTVARKIETIVKGHPYNTKDWMQMNRPLFSALKLEKIAMFIILLALIFMASLLILVALIMVVLEKGKEIAILKSMGATDTSIMKIFVTYGLIIGGIGSGLGLLTGVGVCGLIGLFGIGLDPEIYYITHIPVLIEPVEVLIVTIGAVVISFFATIPPSLFASRLKPVEGLRYE